MSWQRADRALSGRERAVLELLNEGCSHAAIGEHLDLSPRTVETYRARIGAKLGISTRVQLLSKARAIGLLP